MTQNIGPKCCPVVQTFPSEPEEEQETLKIIQRKHIFDQSKKIEFEVSLLYAAIYALISN